MLLVKLYRDCLRLVRHVAPGYSNKALALRQTVRSQFEANRNERNPEMIEAAKANAVRALSNYMLFKSAQNEPRLQKAIKEQTPPTDEGNDGTKRID